MPSTIKSPGVYMNELNAFPNSVAPVATAVPAFTGYTPQASYKGKAYAGISRSLRYTSVQTLPCCLLPIMARRGQLGGG